MHGTCTKPRYSCFDYAGAWTSSLIHSVETALTLGSVFRTENGLGPYPTPRLRRVNFLTCEEPELVELDTY